MKKVSIPLILLLLTAFVNAQSPYGRVYTMLNTKCTNSSCHSATSNGDGPKFDGTQSEVYAAIFNVPSATSANSVAKYEKLVNPQMPYQSFLLRKIAGASFDTDLSLDSTGEGVAMLDTSLHSLSKVEIEWVRQWIRFGALQTYGNNDPQPDYNTIYAYYNDSVIIPFLLKPNKPAPGTGLQFRCGPVFLPATGAVETEITEQQEIHFPYVPEVYELDGYMNIQSHHFLLFNYIDSANARTAAVNALSASGSVDVNNIAQVTPATSNFTEPFAGGKLLTGAWQVNQKFPTPAGTAFFWDQHTYLDMDYHTKNYNATGVLPCDFYLNVFFKPRNTNTIPMLSHLVNNARLGIQQSNCTHGLLPGANSLPYNTSYSENYADQDNINFHETRYIWMMAGHTHSLGTGFSIMSQDSTGQIVDTLYNGSFDYTNNVDLGYWTWEHPPLEYFSHLAPVEFGNNGSGLVCNTTWFDTVSSRCVYFGFTTRDEMQLFYYMYTTSLPVDSSTGIAQLANDHFNFNVMPNPMNNNGHLVYNLDRAAKIEASIIDLTGKPVARLAEENESIGVHQIEISNNQKLAAGMYFARVVVDGVVHTKRFVVTE